MYEFEGGKYKSLALNPSANDDKEAEMPNKKKRFDDNSKKDTLLC